MNEDELYRLAELAFKAKVRELGIPQGPQRDSLWNSILDQLEAMPPEQLQKISQEIPAEQPGMMGQLRNFFNDRTQKAATMDAQEGTTGMDRFATGAVYGAINAPHRLAKGILGIGRMFGVNAPYDRYSEWSKGFEDDYNAVTPYLGKAGMAGEMAGSLPLDIPLYATGMGVASKVPMIGRALASGSRLAQLGGEIAGNAGVDFAQNAVIGAGYDDATPGSMFRDGAVGTALGGVTNVATAGVGAAARAAGRGMRSPVPDVPLKPDYIDNVIADELPPRHGPRQYVWQNQSMPADFGRPAPSASSPFDRPVRGPQPTPGAMDLLSTMMGKASPPPAEELDVVQLANRLYAHKTRNRRPSSAAFAP